MGGGGQYILDTLDAQQYRSRMHQLVKIIPTWQYILRCAKAYLALFMFCEMVHPAL